MAEQDNLTNKQLGPSGLSEWAVFLPAISGFYSTFIGAQRVNNDYVDPARFPKGMTDMEQLNWFNDKLGLFPYKWSLYSGGHANLDLSKDDPKSDMILKRDPNTILVGDSGGFQIGRCLWEGEWRAPDSIEVQTKMADCKARKTEQRVVKTKDKNGNEMEKTVTVDLVKEYQSRLDAAQDKRSAVLNWLDNVSNYAMVLDIPTWIIKNPDSERATGIRTHAEAVAATRYNNEYFMRHRKGVKKGGTKFLNVLQGANHTDADDWYETMKEYCDPVKYPDTHFDGWAMGGQNMCDVHLILHRLNALRFDNLLQKGKHDWMHFLGTSRLEWAVLLTVIQRAIRKHVNENFTISFDCASPFLATANGQVYHHVDLPDDGKWTYRMSPSIDDKKYSTDSRKFSEVALTDGKFKHWDESPISALCEIKDICVYKPGIPKPGVTITPENFQDPSLYDVLPDKNKIDKWGRTSWDSFSYALQMAHNVWTHIYAVQEANRKFDEGVRPSALQRSRGDYVKFEDVVERIFSANTKEEAEDIINAYEDYWMEIIGGRGFIGKKAKNANTMFNALFEEVEPDTTDSDDSEELNENNLEDLENE